MSLAEVAVQGLFLALGAFIAFRCGAAAERRQNCKAMLRDRTSTLIARLDRFLPSVASYIDTWEGAAIEDRRRKEHSILHELKCIQMDASHIDKICGRSYFHKMRKADITALAITLKECATRSPFLGMGHVPPEWKESTTRSTISLRRALLLVERQSM